MPLRTRDSGAHFWVTRDADPHPKLYSDCSEYYTEYESIESDDESYNDDGDLDEDDYYSNEKLPRKSSDRHSTDSTSLTLSDLDLGVRQALLTGTKALAGNAIKAHRTARKQTIMMLESLRDTSDQEII